MEKIKLTERMQAVAQLGGKSRFAVDVGTDHGYLAVWLVQNGRAERVTATDIRPGPLSSARAAVERCGLGGRIRLELCNGLDFEGADEADTVYAAGMGGETIEGILRRAPWTKDGARLVLQPQSKLDELCLWLRISGYGIEEARLRTVGRVKNLCVFILSCDRDLGALQKSAALTARDNRRIRRGPAAGALAGREDSQGAKGARGHGERREKTRHV